MERVSDKSIKEQQALKNKQKMIYFLENNYNTKPELPSSISVFQLLRQYLNDDDFKLYSNEQFVFTSPIQEQKMQSIYKEWSSNQALSLDIDNFIFFWMQKQQHLKIEYSLYEDYQQNQLPFEAKTDFKLNKTQKLSSKIKQKTIPSKISKSTICDNEKKGMQEQYLKQFFNYYCKKEVKTIKHSTFNVYEQFYNTISLTKWMHYVRDMGFYKFKKLFNSQKFKDIFIKFEDNNKCFTYQLFKEAVLYILKLIYEGNEQLIKTQGYQLIGIRNKKYYQLKFAQMKVLPPILLRAKPKLETCSQRIKLRSYDQQIQSKVSISAKFEQQAVFNESQQINKSSLLNISNNLNEAKSRQLKMKKAQQDLNGNRTLQFSKNTEYSLKNESLSNYSERFPTKIKIKLTPKMKQNEKLLQQLKKEEQDDPYLKRYNNKESVDKYHCLMNRIDQRVEKLCQKY